MTTSTATMDVTALPLPTDVIEPLPRATASSTIRSTSTSQQHSYIHKGADYIMKDAMKQTIEKSSRQQKNGPTTSGRRRESFERLQRQMIHGVIQHRNEAPCRSARDHLNVETMTIKKKTQRQRPPSSSKNASSMSTTSNNNDEHNNHDNNKENLATGSTTNNMPATVATTAVKSTRSLMTIQTERTQKRDNLTHWYDQEMEQDEEQEQEVQQQQHTTTTPLRTTVSPKHNHHHQPLMSITKETPQSTSAASSQRRARTTTTTPRRNPPPPPSPFSRTTPSSSRQQRRSDNHPRTNNETSITPPPTQSQLQGTLSPGERSTFVTSIKADYTSPSSNHHDHRSNIRSPVAVTYFTENRHVQQQQRQTSTTCTTEGHRGTLPYGTTTTTTNDDDNNSFGNASIPWARRQQQEAQPNEAPSKKLTFQDMLYYAFAVCRAPDVNRSVLIEDDEEEPRNTCMSPPMTKPSTTTTTTTTSTKQPPSQCMPLSSSQGQRAALHNVAADAGRDLITTTTRRDSVDNEDDVQSQTTQDLLDSVAMRTPARSKPYFVDWTSPASCCSQGTSRTKTTTTSATPSQYTTNSAIMSTQGLYRGCK